MSQYFVAIYVGYLPIEQDKVKRLTAQRRQQVAAALITVAGITGRLQNLLNMPCLVKVIFQRGYLHSEFFVESSISRLFFRASRPRNVDTALRSEEHTSELKSLMRTS